MAAFNLDDEDPEYQAHVRRIVGTAPPLSQWQREKLALLLEPSAGIRAAPPSPGIRATSSPGSNGDAG